MATPVDHDKVSTELSTQIEFERDIKKDPYATKYWWRYLQYKSAAPAKERNELHERALVHIPGSYKLWFSYLTERADQVSDRPLDSPMWVSVINTFERAFIFMSKMPRIWSDYITFLMGQRRVTETRRAIDRALCALPLTQHAKIWKVAHEFMQQDYVPVETGYRMWKRYLQFEPTRVEDFVTYLKKHNRWSDVINTLINVLNNPSFVSMKGRTRHEIWVELCTILSRQGPTLRLEDSDITVDKIIRTGIQKFPNEVGQLWCALANYNTYCRNFEKVRDLYEEGVAAVTTVKDFTQIFSAYSEFEESLLTVKMERMEDGGDADEDEDDEADPYAKALFEVTATHFDASADVDYSLERLEHLMSRRPEMLNSVLLRQNPHNVHEWHKRVEIFKASMDKVVKTYSEALNTIDISQAKGKPHTLWIAFARWYEDRGDLRSAREVLDRAVAQPFKAVDDLASVWCHYAEMEIRAKKYRRALDILKKGTATNFSGQGSWKKVPGQPVQEKTWRSVKLWSLYADLNESLCTVRSTKNVYDRMTYLKVVTPQLILHYAGYMKDNEYWEEAFKVYQQGVQLFQWPHVHDIWVAYISTFVARFKGQKVERMRDLFDQCLKTVPKKMASRFYLMYARFEERYGLARQCIAIYDRACAAVPEEEVMDMFRRYIKVTKKFFGSIKTREVYEKAVKTVNAKHVPELCLEYSAVEESLGEVDRARCLYNHAAQYVDPRKENDFWPRWHQFELDHGNRDTFQTMLRVKRSVQAIYGATIDLEEAAAAARELREKRLEKEQASAAEQAGGVVGASAEKGSKAEKRPRDDGEISFVPASKKKSADDDDDDGLEEQAIPDTVYSGIEESAAKRQRTQE